MKNTRNIILTIMVLALVVPAFAQGKGKPGASVPGPGPMTESGIIPEEHAGNFVSSDDDQVCYDMSALGYILEVTNEMRGFKIDPPVDYDDGNVSTTIQSKGTLLDWVANNATVLAFIIKGGPNYNVYDYVGSGLDADQGLGSPLHKGKRPAISHYNVCYLPDDNGGEQGCTPGYWRNHADRWFGAEPSDDFDTTFGVDLFSPDITLGTAIWLGGGDANALARHATAALLNALGGVKNADGTTVAYPYSSDEVIQMVQDAVADETIEATKDILAAANELGCPLSGTKAVKVE